MSDLIDRPAIRSAMQGESGQIERAWAGWFNRAYTILFAVTQSGVTADRPTSGLWTGRTYFDTTLGKPIWWNGSSWRFADGTAA